ncbi:hypothetical protein BEL04_13725 [Mucilaginibacter sp. PPCGB 2223]|uniref:RagB/SusD family nutrient uptake outer membrane protein n=1 Tax=Mucilaginibacter sp. PPCGB 2223 TaxID=1886027 RepID=UPI0008258708|nr:RagB/SusD family nutrient uptake outer membrane protein [Mucilaginibacter sp. PPCGB 2223]OCX52513.1 hypothetical protein BEL04_13725 [Mucilaginibacter sp. PPCGB 2223]
MKKILYTAALASVLVAGCSKSDLDLYPYNQVATEQAFNSQQLVQFDINGMYQGLRASGSYAVGTWNIIADVLSDNLVLDQVGRQSLKTYYQYTYSSNSTYGLFTGGYTVTRRANAILENIDKLPDGTFKNDARGQALALRAMLYFDMARVYSKTYLNASASDFTLPYVTTSSATNVPPSESLQGFYGKVIADLVAAEPLINPIATNTNIYLNREAVAGLLSRVYLYKGDYANCIAEANKALGTTPNLPNIATFPSIWTDATNAGVLFKVKNTSLDNINSPGVNYYQFTTRPTPTSTQNGYKSEYLPDFSFYQLYAATDVRKSAYFQTNYYNGTLYNHIIKYAGRSGPPELGIGIPNPSVSSANPAGVVDGKLLRTAEVLLNRMEAEYRSGAIPAAVADLVLLKSNRYTGYDPTADNLLTGAPLLNEILKQRRLELAFEGDRFWDLKRLNLPVQRDATHGEAADGSGVPPNVATLPAGDNRFNLPYPQSEINFNPGIKQNPGY